MYSSSSVPSSTSELLRWLLGVAGPSGFGVPFCLGSVGFPEVVQASFLVGPGGIVPASFLVGAAWVVPASFLLGTGGVDLTSLSVGAGSIVPGSLSA